MRSVVSAVEFLPRRQKPKRVCPICSKFYVYFCIVCCNKYSKSDTNNKSLSVQGLSQHPSYISIAKDTFLKLLISLCSYILDASAKLTKVIDIRKPKTLERIYFRPDMEEDSGVDSKQETLSMTSTTSNDSNRSAGERKSSASLHRKRSSNVFIQLMRSKKKKAKLQEGAKSKEESKTASEIAIKDDCENDVTSKTSKSKIPVPVQKKEVAEVQTQPTNNSDLLEESNEILTENTQLQSDSSASAKAKKGNSFFTKFIKKSNRNAACMANEKDLISTSSEKQKCEEVDAVISETSANYENDDMVFEAMEKITPTNYMKRFNDTLLDISLTDALQQVVSIETKLKDDQIHVTQLLEKYIHDEGFKKDLLDAVYQYSKLQLDTERRIQNLANEMWIQQAEISRNQENSLQETLNALIKQNRQLQEENEQLLRNNEKLSAKISSLTYLTPRANLGGNHVVESMAKNNEQLHLKLNSAMKRVVEFEEELQKVQRHNERLEEKLRRSNTQIQNYKAIIQRNRADFDIEIASLSQKLQSNLAIVKTTTEAGDVLLEDLDALKRKLKASLFNFNWIKFKCRGNSLTDLIHMGRACINELAQEIVNLQTQIALKDKDNDCLREQSEQLQEEVHKLREEVNIAKNKEEMIKEYETEKHVYVERSCDLHKEINRLQMEITHLNELINNYEARSEASNNEITKLRDEIEQKDESLEHMQKFIEEAKSENSVLVLQIHSLNKILQESGAGDMEKQLSEVQERMSHFEKHYYQVANERNYLMEQVRSSNLEVERLIQQQQIYRNQLQNQCKEVEGLIKSKTSLSEQVNADKITIAALQEERKRYLEEKNVLRTIYERLRKEIAHSEQLQGTVANMSIEANKLTVILAECNKLLGEKLKTEVKQREETISQLQHNIKELSNANLETTKDKIALCMELNQACTAKEYLNKSLNTEMEKNISLDETKKSCQEDVMNKLKAVEQMQKAERVALKKLLEDYKKVVAQRDQLLQKQEEWYLKINHLQENCDMQMKHSAKMSTKCDEKEHSIRELEKLLQEKQYTLNRSQADTEKFRISCARLSGIIEELKAEKGKVEANVTFLQNTCQKLNTDLKDTKCSEMELKTALNNKEEENKKLQNMIEELSSTLQNMQQEKNKMEAEIENLSSVCNKLINEYQNSMREATETEKQMKKEIQALKLVSTGKSNQIRNLEEAICVKANEIRELNAQCKALQNEKLQKLVIEEELGIQTRLLNVTTANHEKILDELNQLQKKYEDAISKSVVLSEELNNVKGELQTVFKEKEEDYESYKTQLDEIKQEFDTENRLLKKNLEEICEKYEELEEIYEQEELSVKSLSDSHKDISSRLLKAARLLIDEKVARQTEKCRLEVVTDELNKLKAEKDTLANKVATLMTELTTLEKQYNSLENDKLEVQKAYERYKQANESTKNEFVSMEQQESITKLQNELSEAHDLIQRLKLETEKLTKDITALEFQKCELSLRVYELQGELNTEISLNAALQQSQQHIFDIMIQLKEKGEISDNTLTSLMEKQKSYGLHNN